MAKSEGSSSITSKVTGFFWKVPTTIFVKPGQCPCKLVKMENDITSSKIDVGSFQKKVVTLEIKMLEPSNFAVFALYDELKSYTLLRRMKNIFDV